MGCSLPSSNGASATSDRLQSSLDPKEQRLRLLQDPKFRLLKIQRSDGPQTEIQSLTVVTPASDPSIAEDVKQTGWICLSHMWGPPSEWVEWTDAGVLDGDTGDVITVKVQPKKCKQIMELLRMTSIRYWWIDVFCAQSDTPLVIMGDIYKYCSICYALIDTPYETFYGNTFLSLVHATRMSKICLEEAARGYLEMVSKRDHNESQSTDWTQILNDLLHWPSQCLQDGAYRFLQIVKEGYPEGSKPKQFLTTFLELPVDKRKAAVLKLLNSKEYNPNDFGGISGSDMLYYHGTFSVEDLNKAQQGLSEFLDGGWMSRVWTLQELALPKEITLPFDNFVFRHLHYFEDWQISFSIFLKVIMTAYKIRTKASMATQLNQKHPKTVRTPRQLLEHYQRTDPVLAHIYRDYRKVLEVTITLGYNSKVRPEDKVNDALARRFILTAFATSQRKAYFPIDYVYGVLGVLDIDVPRMEDPKEVWSVFSKKLRERYPDIYVPDDVNLAGATKMEDVYGQLGFTRENEISHDIVEYVSIPSSTP